MSDHIVARPDDCPACLKEELAELREELSAARALKLDTGHIPTLSDADLDHFERYLGFGGGETSRITLGLIREARASRAALARMAPVVDAANAWVRHDEWDYVGDWADEQDEALIAAVDAYRALEGEQS